MPSSTTHRRRPQRGRTPDSRRSVIAAALAASSIAWLLVSSAAAAGGASIATAPTVAYGQQQFANPVADGPAAPSASMDRSWWLFPVTAGDQVTMDWETTDDEIYALLFPVGTTDFTYPNTRWQESDPNDNLKAEFKWSAPVTGTMPLEFTHYRGTEGGPTDFTAYVQHAVTLGLPAVSSLAQTGSVAINLRNPDGAPLSDPALVASLQAKPHGAPDGAWVAIGSAPAVSGVATIAYSLPAGLTGALDLRAVSQGTGYLAGTSGTLSVAGPAAPVPAAAPPSPAVPVARAITISRVHGRYRGRVSSAERACRKGVTVVLLRKSTGAKVYGTAVTRADGSWTMRSRKVRGKVYAAVAQATVRNVVCGQTASRFTTS